MKSPQYKFHYFHFSIEKIVHFLWSSSFDILSSGWTFPKCGAVKVKYSLSKKEVKVSQGEALSAADKKESLSKWDGTWFLYRLLNLKPRHYVIVIQFIYICWNKLKSVKIICIQIISSIYWPLGSCWYHCLQCSLNREVLISRFQLTLTYSIYLLWEYIWVYLSIFEYTWVCQ